MDFRKLAYDFLNTGVVQPNSLNINQRIFVANLFGLIGFTITFLMGVSVFIRQYNLLGAVLHTASLLFLSTYLITRSRCTTNPYKYSANLVTLPLLPLMIYSVYSDGVNGTGS